MIHPHTSPWVVRPLVLEAVYTDRQEFLDYFHHIAHEAAHRRTMSTVLLGRRRMGKTEIFKRVVNRLFFEQDPTDPLAVLPVYYSFPDTVRGEQSFAIEYLENFMRYYVGFYTRQPTLVTDMPSGTRLLARIEQARRRYPFTRMLDLLLEKYATLVEGTHLPAKTAIWTPRQLSDLDDSTHVMFLDEFQNTRLPQYQFDIVGWMQEAVESPTCPHFVTGSAMSILAREIIGRRSLFGRFRSKTIEPLSGYWGTELTQRAAHYYQAEVSELLAPVVAMRCGGNPFYITAVVRQSVELAEPLVSESAINRTLAIDISSGFIWGELHDQVTQWIERLNNYGITKWILYLSALEEDDDEIKKDRISLKRIQRELRRREGHEVSLSTIKEVLVKLSRGDLLEYLELGGWFRKIDDPILLEFLKVWGKTEVEGQPSHKVQQALLEKYQTMEKRVHEYKGYLAEVFMSQILYRGQRKTLPGALFHSPVDIQFPPRFVYIEQRVRLGSGTGKEIDILGAAGAEMWVCQSKWVTRDPLGPAVLRELLAQAATVRIGRKLRLVRLWLFAYQGLTATAQELAQEHGILWSTRADLDGLLEYLGLRKLPVL